MGVSFLEVNGVHRTERFDILTSPGVTPPVRLVGRVICQLAGGATSFTGRVEHCTRDPGSSEANWAPADDTGFSGDLSAGMSPRPYEEPAVGWWRVNVTAITGGDCKVSLIGGKA